MKWKAEFEIGIATIDTQHKKIFEYLLAIENSIAKKDSRDIQRFFYTQLSDYLAFHFAVEEAMLDALKYPEFESHRGGHGKLSDAIRTLEQKALKSGSATELVAFFEEWFIGHVLSDDRNYASYVTGLLAGR